METKFDLMGLCDAYDTSSFTAHYMKLVLEEAAKSGDKSTKNGAIILQGGEIVARGHNDFIPGFGHLPEHHERPFKYSVIEHAERAVMYDAARNGAKTEGGLLVANWVACPDCARAIVLCGIEQVIAHERCMNRTPDRWFEEVSLGLKILREGGVKVYYYDGYLGVDNLNNGEWIKL